MSNFDFLKPSYSNLHRVMVKAESRVFTEPKTAAHSCRLALEEAVHLIYREERFEMPFDTRLANLMRERDFTETVSSLSLIHI